MTWAAYELTPPPVCQWARCGRRATHRVADLIWNEWEALDLPAGEALACELHVGPFLEIAGPARGLSRAQLRAEGRNV